MTLRCLSAFLVVAALAIFFRIYQIDQIPPGLYIDEAQNGLDASAIARGEGFPVYIESIAKPRGREPMLHYLMAGVFTVFGPTTVSVRLTSALIGIAGVLAFFFLCQRFFGLQAAFFAGILLAVSRWHVTFSRIGMRAVLVPLWLVLTLLAFNALVQKRRPGAAILFGITLGLGLYTYPAYWIVPLPLVVLLVIGARRGAFRDLRRFAVLGTVAFAAFLVTAGPLMYYAATSPESYLARVTEVRERAETGSQTDSWVRDNVQKVLFMFHLRGDPHARHNIPDRPLLDPVTGVLFLIGLYVMLRTIRADTPLKWAVLLFWLVPLLPSVFSDEAPHAMRSLGAAPAACLIAAFGLQALSDLGRRSAVLDRLRAPVVIPLVLLALVTVWNFDDYFRRWGRSEAVAEAFTAGVPPFFAYLADLADEHEVYVSPYVYYSPNVRFLNLARQAALKPLVEESALMAGEGEQRDRVFVSESAGVNFLIEQLYPEAEQISRYSVWGAREGKVYRVKGGALHNRLTESDEEQARYYINRMVAAFRQQSRRW